MPYYARVESTLRRDWGKSMDVVAEGLRVSVHDAVTDGAKELRATRRFRDRSGKLYASIKGKLDSYNRLGAQGTISVGESPKKLKYAIFLVKGTKAHFIQARRASALRFIADGGVRFAFRVRHPGTKPAIFMERGARVAEQPLGHGIAKAIAAGGKAMP
jgi:hypothetical protein